jgi:flagellar biosynthetic protein FliQ
METMIEYTGKGFLIMLLLSMPSVLTAAAIGLVVGILQAVTQVQEQTIAAAPKMLGVFIVIMIMGPFSVRTLEDYFKETTNIAFEVLPKTDEMVLSGNDFYNYRNKLKDTHYGEKVPSYKDYKDNPGKLPFADTKLKERYRKPMKGSDSAPNFIEQKQIYNGQKG